MPQRTTSIWRENRGVDDDEHYVVVDADEEVIPSSLRRSHRELFNELGISSWEALSAENEPKCWRFAVSTGEMSITGDGENFTASAAVGN